MTELKCSVTTCANNADNCCCRPDITVEGPDACCCGDTCCCSFQEKEEAASNVMRHDVPNRALSIRCSVHNCVYNGDGACHAESISVTGSGACCDSETECATFQKR